MATLRQDNELRVALKKIDDWDCCILDEVHMLPAPKYQNILRDLNFKVKIGLTATPFREDNKINDLFFMVGPKLYEENILDLIR